MAYEYWIGVPLTCLATGEIIAATETGLVATGINPMLHDAWIHLGDVLPITAEEFEPAFTYARETNGGEIRVLAGWACPGRIEAEWARLIFIPTADAAGVVFAAASSVALTPEEVDAAHFVSNGLADHIGALTHGAARNALFAALGAAHNGQR